MKIVLSQRFTNEKFNQEFGKDLKLKKTCECCSNKNGDLLYVASPSTSNVIVVAHICFACANELSFVDDYSLFNKSV